MGWRDPHFVKGLAGQAVLLNVCVLYSESKLRASVLLSPTGHVSAITRGRSRYGGAARLRQGLGSCLPEKVI